MDTNTKKQTTPVYLSVPQIARLMELVSTRKFENVSFQIFRGYGFNESDAALAVSALRFLGLVDDKNNATELMDKMRLKGDMRKREFELILRSAYTKVFDAVENPHNLPLEELMNEFNVRYRDSIKSDRVARAAVFAFLKFCEYAGLREEKSVVVRKARPTEGTFRPKQKPFGSFAPQKRNEQDSAPASDSLYSFPIVPGKFYINIETALHNRSFLDDTLSTDLRAFIKEAHKFAKTHITNAETPASQGSEGT